MTPPSSPETPDHLDAGDLANMLSGMAASIPDVTMTISITVDDSLGRDLAAEVGGGNRSAVVSTAIREYLDRRNLAAAAAWHASLTGDDAANLAEFDATW